MLYNTRKQHNTEIWNFMLHGRDRSLAVGYGCESLELQKNNSSIFRRKKKRMLNEK